MQSSKLAVDPTYLSMWIILQIFHCRAPAATIEFCHKGIPIDELERCHARDPSFFQWLFAAAVVTTQTKWIMMTLYAYQYATYGRDTTDIRARAVKTVDNTWIITCSCDSELRLVGTHPAITSGSADVWKGQQHNGLYVALKVHREHSSSSSSANKNGNLKEVYIWRHLNHKNVLPFLGLYSTELLPRVALISPWMENGNLRGFLRRKSNVDRVLMMIGVANGLNYMHTFSPPIVHGDLKCANILIDNSGNPLISDFGLAGLEGDRIVSGSIRWQAPEILQAMFSGDDARITRKTDMYAFGMTLLEVFTEEVPFPDLRDGAVMLAVAVSDKRPPRPNGLACERGLADYVWRVITNCWLSNSARRPTIGEVMAELCTEYVKATVNRRTTCCGQISSTCHIRSGLAGFSERGKNSCWRIF